MKKIRPLFYLLSFFTVPLFLVFIFFLNLYEKSFTDSFINLFNISIAFIFIYIEWIVVCILYLLLYRKNLASRLVGHFIAASVLIIQIVQFFSLYNSQEYITPLALAHAELVGLLITPKSILILVLCLLVPFVIINLFLKKINSFNYRKSSALILLLVCASLVVLENNSTFFKIKKMDYLAIKEPMVSSFISRLKKYDSVRNQVETEVIISKAELDLLKEHGMYIQTGEEFPLIKDFIYKEKIPYEDKNLIKKPNVIVFFVESFNSRFVGAYDDQYAYLTPNIINFAKKSTTVKNYFNHAFPTIVGLRGQFCSSFPRLQNSVWSQAQYDIKTESSYCLPKLFNKEGYETVYFGYSHPNETFFKKQIHEFGFQESFFYSDLLEKFVPDSLVPERKHYGNSDSQMMRATINFLKDQDGSKPFFLSLSTIETHPGMDVLEKYDSSALKNIESPTLRNISNFDTQFGVFWDYFKNSPYFENTIVILTADHAHVPNVDYIKVAGKGYSKDNYFDPNTLIIFDPTRKSPSVLETNGTSIDFAPTVAQLANIPNQRNHFLGLSLYTDRKNHKGALGMVSQSKFLMNGTGEHDISYLSLEECSKENISDKCSLYRGLRYTQYLSSKDLIWREHLLKVAK